ncbi:MAG TPA: hypothetical protein PKA33_21340 [Amaricoccus sp.]|uniref:DUF6538 domain-containing protein n=1 Tax=Amaricoccus sp. TaxID=1872485 RepID=UPI002C44FE47|nr:DUF6538 domain-containing protein [Amaricoccus sp.]HMQ95270.1 hypothetical protein [Amaricoccus sp.]HMR54891.1 hypothetical protein [Amaricoccus sp.]HMU01873.1 hypothetical protein [Amaricoccus sp.]
MPSGSNLEFSDIFKQAPEIWLWRHAHGSIGVQERQPAFDSVENLGGLGSWCGASPKRAAQMHPHTAYVRRRGDSFSFRRRPPVNLALAHRGNNTRPHLTVALWTRDPREAARRAAKLNVIAEAGWAVGLSESDMLGLSKAVAHLGAQLPDLPPAQRVEAERRNDDEARKAIAGQPHRLDDPDFLDAFG